MFETGCNQYRKATDFIRILSVFHSVSWCTVLELEQGVDFADVAGSQGSSCIHRDKVQRFTFCAISSGFVSGDP